MTNAVKYFFLFLIQIVNGKMEGFVVGGGFADIKHYPHVAFLSGQCGQGTWMCGSSVLNQQILLTAAHCVDKCIMKNAPFHDLMVLLGHDDVDKALYNRAAETIIRHSKYDEMLVENDIGLILLKRSVPLGDNVKRIIITDNFPELGYEGILAGWGHTGQKNRASIHLKHVHQQLRSITTCSKVGQLHKGMFCAAQPKEQSYPASGDSGSGLITIKGYNVIGIVSFKNLRIEHLTVYTNVSYYYNWIQRHAKALYCRH